MAEKIIKIPVSELSSVRLICQHKDCGGVAEIPSRRLEALTGENIPCPSCGRAFKLNKVADVGGLKALGMMLTALNSSESRLEFVISNPAFADER